MLPRNAIIALLLVAMATTACSRLTFIRPDYTRKGDDIPQRDYDFKTDKAAEKRYAARQQALVAEQRLRAGQFDEAIRQANVALKTDPDSAEAYTVLAFANARLGNDAVAGGHYAKAVELAPKRGAMLNNYGVWLCSNGRETESLAQFDAALRDPLYATPIDARANAGSCALAAGQLERAERDLRMALDAAPKHPSALEAMAELRFKQGDFLGARAFSERRLAAAPPTPTVLSQAAEIERRLGDHAAAAKYVQMKQSRFPQRESRPGDSPSP